jgi:predicted acylesterase/phospholipase RssA
MGADHWCVIVSGLSEFGRPELDSVQSNGPKRSVRCGASPRRFDTNLFLQATFFTRGSMTFREAYERTGRALNISVVPHDQHSPTKLLNHLTAPDCVIWSAISE